MPPTPPYRSAAKFQADCADESSRFKPPIDTSRQYRTMLAMAGTRFQHPAPPPSAAGRQPVRFTRWRADPE
ncbi:MAG: hypothetical protein R3F55_18275 [Alphaproteobacteria bacterium]